MSTVPSNVGDEREIAAVWRTCFAMAFYVHICITIVPIIGGILVCRGGLSLAIGFVLYLVSAIFYLVKCAIFWWAAILRLS